MTRINEADAAKAYVEKLREGGYPIERAKNDAVDYRIEKEQRDTDAVRAFTKSTLFQQFKNMR